MKIINLILIILCSVSISSCNDDNSYDTIPQPELGGGWTLVNVTGGIAGTSDDFPEGEIQWIFNTNGTVNIVNTNTDAAEVDFFETGEYYFSMTPNTVTPESCALNLIIDNTNFGCLDIEGNVLTLNQVEADGYALTFHKILQPN